MRQETDTQRLNAFIDGELDLADQLAMEARINDDPDWRARVEALRQLRAAVRQQGDYHAAPAELRSRLAASLGTAGAAAPDARRPGVPRTASVASFAQRWLAWRPLAVAFALAGAAFVALQLAWLQPAADAALLRQVLASHVRSSFGERLVDVASSDRHTVKPWLSARLDFAPPVVDAPSPGTSFVGGRIDYLDDRPVAALVYKTRQHVIDAYVWPTAQADRASRGVVTQRGFNVVHWVRGGMTFWVVSDVNGDELAGFARAFDAAANPRP